MADVKISGLPAGTSLTGTEVVPVVQSGTTVKVTLQSIADLSGDGTVTSVGMTVPTGLIVTGSPITTNGTLAVTYDTGYAIPTTAKQTNWDLAYSWGNHATAGYMDSGDIGVTVQGYDAYTVIDASYVHTDNNYTTTEKSKLAGIAAGAEVNVNADWNAVSGDAQILNKPTIPTKTSDLTNDSGFVTSSGVTSITAGTGLSGGTITSTGTIALANTTVTAGTYTNANITVDAQGRITSATNGTAGGVTSFNTRTGAVTLASSDVATALGFTPGTGTVTSVTAGTGLSGGTITGSGTVALANTTVTAGSYTNASVTVDAQGRLTSASSGTAPVTSVSGTAGRVISSGGTTPVIDLDTTAVTAGSYTNTSLTVDAYGRITAASNGSGGGGSSTLTFNTQTTAYTVVAADTQKIVQFTGTGAVTCSLTAAATLGTGFNCWIWNDKTTGILTIDPNGTETIAGSTTITLLRGEGIQIVCDGTNWKVNAVRQSQLIQTDNSNSSVRATATGSYSTAIGANSGATGSNTTAAGAMSLGGSYASGADSFAAAITSNSSPYGATGTSGVAIGANNRASSTYATSIGGFQNIASGTWSTCLGGRSCTAAYDYSIAFGYVGTPNVVGKMAFGHISGTGAGIGWGKLNLYKQTTDATPAVLVTDAFAAGSTNQVILPNNSAYAFTGTIIARQQAAGGSNYAAWEIKGAIIRDASAAATTLGSYNINTLSQTAGASTWTIALSADTTNGGLAITVTGAAATNIRWVATVHTSEVTYA